jgi:hypothetical protein
MKVLKCEFGKLEYRYPNIPEAFELLGSMGVNSTTAQDKKALLENDVYYTAQLVKAVGQFITKIDITIGEKKIDTYEELLNHFEMLPHLIKVSEEIMKVMDLEGKKKRK